MEIGFIGIELEAQKLLLRIEKKGYSVSIFDKNENLLNDFMPSLKDKNIKGYKSIDKFVQSLKKPTIIFIMVADDMIDVILDELAPYLLVTDIVINCSNTYYLNTERRAIKHFFNFIFVGCGVLSEDNGAKNDPCLMPGGSINAWPTIKKLFHDISAKYERDGKIVFCCDWIGPGGSGQFVKMVHDGIKCSEMAILSEVYLCLKGSGMETTRISKLFSEWNEENGSYLLETASKILGQREDNIHIINKVVQQAPKEIVSEWFLKTAMECNESAVINAESIFSRILSCKNEKAFFLYKNLSIEAYDYELPISHLKHAYILARTVAYIQGFNLIKNMSNKRNWKIDLNVVARIWQCGSVIRSDFLEEIQNIISDENDELEFRQEYLKIIQKTILGLRMTILFSISKGIPVPAMKACLSYLDGLIDQRIPGEIVQWIHDYKDA
ncbi:6-phosphogluconate dehydrogenase, decarboxylating [Astathelohania contejeani]|uniref:phosphogluconate dehydrogenase (NADP(+)-dependent, decarboxylating) n=1 Tax=Astathelohania contejeani TaxID=164912 RepID=A0ABQ7I0P2_9MICR|nr:6-phosphogluconate dehydrogenase, decarboxylating [Thelohania contejeani]